VTADPWAWTNESWTGNDKPFATARQSVERLFQSGVDAGPFISRYYGLAKANPSNALDQFRWAYATYMQWRIPHPIPGDNFPVLQALASATQPHCYDYDRIRLLIYGEAAEERGLAERLLSIDPKDVLVKTVYAAILSVSKQKQDDDKAVQIETSIVQSGQDSPRCYYVLGQIYAIVGYLQQDPSDYTQAIVAENRFLSLTPAYDWRCAAARHCIQVLQSRLEAEQ